MDQLPRARSIAESISASQAAADSSIASRMGAVSVMNV